MSSTPTRRVSLRRKRHTKSADVTGSPVSKKSSPLREDKVDEASVNFVKSKVYTSRLVQSRAVSASHEPASLPKNDVQSNHITSEEKHCSTPCTTPDSNHQQQESHPQRQHSPDTPFICSQLCGTQECEVVWDCNSPGYSKDDLKRMPGGDNGEGEAGASPVIFIAPLPHRTLFPKAKGRPSPAASVESTTAQLDELLYQLRKGENNPGESKDFASHPPLLETVQKFSQTDGSSSMIPEEGCSTTVSLPGLLKGTSSQPFDVLDENCQDGTVNLASDLDDSLFGEDDLNVGICDISAINLVSLRKTLSGASNEADKVNVADEVKDHSSASADMFDDDLFNDSVIRTTQAMEEALASKDNGNLMAKVSEGRGVNELKQSDKSFKRHNTIDDCIFKPLSADGVEGDEDSSLQKDIEVSGSRTSDRRANVYSRTIHKSTGVNQNIRTVLNTAHFTGTSGVDIQVANQDSSNCDSKLLRTTSSNISKLDTYNTCDPTVDKDNVDGSKRSCSPILGKPRISADDPPQRRIRNSFRLGSDVSFPQKKVVPSKFKSNSVVLSVSSDKHVSSVLVKEKCFSAHSGTCKTTVDNVFVESENSNPLLKEFISENIYSSLKEHCESKNTCKSNGILTVPENEVAELSKAPSIHSQKTDYFSHDPQLTRVPSGKSVCRNSVSSQIGRLTDRTQTVRGPLLRSHSTGNAKFSNSVLSTTVRRSNSSLEMDVSREFEEDDEFFESLLSVLPEDEEQLFEKSKLQSEAHMLECKKNVSPQGEKCNKNTIRFQESIEAHRKSSSSRGIHTSRSLTLIPNNLRNVRKITSEPEEQVVNSMPVEIAQIEYKSNVGLTKNQKNLRPGTYKLSSVLMKTSCDVKQDGEVEDHKPFCFSNPAPTHLQSSDILDDDLFEDDVLTLLDEVESQYGSQQTHSEMSNSQSSYSQQLRCTQDEIARKKEAAQRLRQEKQKQRHQRREYPSVC